MIKPVNGITRNVQAFYDRKIDAPGAENDIPHGFRIVGSRKEPLRVRNFLLCRARCSRGHLRSKTVHGPENYEGLRANKCTNSTVLEPGRATSTHHISKGSPSRAF